MVKGKDMGIEAIGSALSSVASGVARGTSGIGRVSVAAPSFSGPMINIGRPGVIEGPGFLPGFKPMGAADIKPPSVGGEVKPSLFGFKPIETKLNTASVVKQAESIISNAQQVSKPLNTQEVLMEANHWLGFNKPKVLPIAQIKPSVTVPSWRRQVVEPGVRLGVKPAVLPSWIEIPQGKPIPREVVLPGREPMVKPQVKVLPEIVLFSKPDAGQQVGTKAVESATVMPAFQEQIQEEEVEQVVEERVNKEAKSLMDEEIITEKGKLVLDEEVLSQRKNELRQAVVKAKAEAVKLGLDKIAGWLVAKFLPPEREETRSGIVKWRGPDGSHEETVEAVGSFGEFDSEQGAVQALYKVAEEKKPVRLGKEGIKVTVEDVARVFKYRFVKSFQPVEQVVRRVIRKKAGKEVVVQGVQEAINTVTKPGQTLESVGLTGVFSKAV